jgi:hypothetical protein
MHAIDGFVRAVRRLVELHPRVGPGGVGNAGVVGEILGLRLHGVLENRRVGKRTSRRLQRLPARRARSARRLGVSRPPAPCNRYFGVVDDELLELDPVPVVPDDVVPLAPVPVPEVVLPVVPVPADPVPDVVSAAAPDDVVPEPVDVVPDVLGVVVVLDDDEVEGDVVELVDGVVAGGVVVVDDEDEDAGGVVGGASVCCWQAPSANSTLAATAVIAKRFISGAPL